VGTSVATDLADRTPRARTAPSAVTVCYALVCLFLHILSVLDKLQLSLYHFLMEKESPIVSQTLKNEKSYTNEERGKRAELLFSHFLDNNKIPFVYIDQTKETISEKMYEKFIRRPDFIVHTKYGFYFIDVKCREKQILGNEKRFYLNQGEVNSLNNLQNELQANVWVAFIDDKDLNNNNFYFTPIIRIYEYYEYIISGFSKNYNDIMEFFPKCPICIPNNFLFDSFSFEKGFYKSSDIDYSINDVSFHVDKMIEWLRKESYKK